MSAFNDILVAAAEYLPNATHEEVFGVGVSRGLVIIYTALLLFQYLIFLSLCHILVQAGYSFKLF